MGVQARFDLSGKVALVTGGSRGIGEAAALALAEAGADVAVASRTVEQSRAVAARVADLGRRSLAVRADVRQVDSIRAMVDEVSNHFGRVDILVNSAGINILRPVLEVKEDEWDRILDTNLKGLFFTCQAVGRLMVEQNYGRIVNIASQMAVVGYFNRAAYCASKGGVAQVTKVMAIEWARHNVTVNAVAPTFIETTMTAKMFQDEEFRAEVLGRIPMGRLGSLDEVTGAVLYLASDAASLVTGHTLLVDGGWTAW